MKKAWADFWERYKDFSGKTTRSEYWLMVGLELLIIGIMISFGPIAQFISRKSMYDFLIIRRIFSILWIFLLTFVVPNFSLSVRRFNDIGMPHGFSELLAVLGYAMAIIALFCQLTNFSGTGFILLMIAGDMILMLIAALPANAFKHSTTAK